MFVPLSVDYDIGTCVKAFFLSQYLVRVEISYEKFDYNKSKSDNFGEHLYRCERNERRLVGREYAFVYYEKGSFLIILVPFFTLPPFPFLIYLIDNRVRVQIAVLFFFFCQVGGWRVKGDVAESLSLGTKELIGAKARRSCSKVALTNVLIS